MSLLALGLGTVGIVGVVLVITIRRIRGSVTQTDPENLTADTPKQKEQFRSIRVPKSVQDAEELRVCRECMTANSSSFSFCRQCASPLLTKTFSSEELENGVVTTE